MSMRKVSFVEGEYYHVYNRGNDKRVIFHDEKDYGYFMNLLLVANSKVGFNVARLSRNKNNHLFDLEIEKKIVSIGAYVLMPNHFHILITQKEKEGISKFMQKLCTGYAMYYNKKYKRTGGLFEGKFKSQYLDTDRYLKYIFSYIHLNPVKLIDKTWKEKGIKNLSKGLVFLKQYKYSSFIDYTDTILRKEYSILNKEDFPNYFPNKNNFYKEIVSWLKYDR